MSKSFLFYLVSVSFLSIVGLSACLEDDEPSYKYTMCGYPATGNVYCYTNYDGAASCSGETIATYGGLGKCENDAVLVEDDFADYGYFSPGPNALYAGPEKSGSGSGSGGSGSGSGSGGSCNMDTVWSGSSDDHAQYYCLDACNWINIGGANAQTAVEINCSSLEGFGATSKCNISC